jgi:3-hydroxybutyryl-CoA dehydrogenase
MHDRAIKTAVLGAGTIGASWAALFLAAGHEVHVHDVSEQTQRFVSDYVRNAWPSLQALNLAPAGPPPHAYLHRQPEDAASLAEFVQESVPEQLDAKLELFRRIEPHLRPQTIVASSASGLLVRE